MIRERIADAASGNGPKKEFGQMIATACRTKLFVKIAGNAYDFRFLALPGGLATVMPVLIYFVLPKPLADPNHRHATAIKMSPIGNREAPS